MTLTAAPEVNGSNWTVDRPYTNKRYSFITDEWLFVIRDLGTSTLWRLHALDRATGEVITFGRDDHGNNQDGLDGLQTLFGAATRVALKRVRESDEWKTERYPSLTDDLFFGLLD